MPRAFILPAGDPPDAKITFPRLKQGSSGASAGVVFTWIAEGGTIDETSFELDEGAARAASSMPATFRSRRSSCDNSAVASALIMNLLNLGPAIERDNQLLTGNGIGKPLGVLHADNNAAAPHHPQHRQLPQARRHPQDEDGAAPGVLRLGRVAGIAERDGLDPEHHR